MKAVLGLKFTDLELSEKLLATGDAELIEGNHWNDTFWGVCDGVGKNWLGILLMEIREELKKSAEELCPQCNKNVAVEYHCCPYRQEIDGEETECNCCEECQQECSDHI